MIIFEMFTSQLLLRELQRDKAFVCVEIASMTSKTPVLKPSPVSHHVQRRFLET